MAQCKTPELLTAQVEQRHRHGCDTDLQDLQECRMQSRYEARRIQVGALELMRAALAAAFHGTAGLAWGIDARTVGAELFAGGLGGVVTIGEAVR